MENKFPFLAVEADYIISKDADITAVFEVDLPELFTVTAAECEAIHAAWARAIKVLPNYTVVHKQGWFIREDHRSQTDKEDLSFLSRSYEMHFSERPFSSHKCYLYLTKTTRERMRIQNSFSSLCRRFITPKGVSKDTTTHFPDTVGQFARAVSDARLIHLRRLAGDEITGTENKAGLVEKYFCLSMGNATALEDIELGDNGLRVGGKHASVHTFSEPDALPSKVGTGCRYERLSADKSDCKPPFAGPVGPLLSCNHLYSQYVFLDDSSESLQCFEKSARSTQSLSKYSRSNQINKEWISLHLNNAYLFRLTSMHAYCNIITWTDNPMEVKNMCNGMGNQITMTECKPHHNTADAVTLYRATMSGNGVDSPAEESLYAFIEQALCFWVEETNYCGSVSPFGLKVPDHISKKPLHADTFDLPMKRDVTASRNKLVPSGSGGGKSFFMNHLARQYYKQSTHVVLIDTRSSYQKLCSLVHQESGGKDGIYFTYTDESPITFNSFSTDDKVFDTEKRESIRTLILTFWKRDNESAARSEEMALSNMVSLYIRRIRGDEGIVLSFNTFYEFVKTDYRRILEEKKVQEKDSDLAEFLGVLEPYYRDGEYDFLLNSDKQSDLLGKRFIVFETDQIEDHSTLFSVTTTIIMKLFINKMCRLKGVHKMIIIEEAWKAIAEERTADYIRYLFKAVRKFYGEAVVIIQEVGDIISSPIVKESIVSSDDCRILLNQRRYPNKFLQIQSLLGLTNKEKTQILSVNISDDPRCEYKEVWFGLGGVQSIVYATEVSLEEYLCCSAEGSKEVEPRGPTKELGGNIGLAIRRFAEKKRNQNSEVP